MDQWEILLLFYIVKFSLISIYIIHDIFSWKVYSEWKGLDKKLQECKFILMLIWNSVSHKLEQFYLQMKLKRVWATSFLINLSLKNVFYYIISQSVRTNTLQISTNTHEVLCFICDFIVLYHTS
jgi:hypothetical protein